MSREDGFRKLPLVEVSWVDSASTNGWRGKQEPDDVPCKCRTVGYLLKRTKRTLTVAQNLSEFGSTGEWMQIPAAVVKRVRRLK